MAFRVFVKPADVWGFFSSRRDQLKKEQVLIAENDDGCEIYLTEQDGFPLFTVYLSGKKEYEEAADDSVDCDCTMNILCNIYLRPDDDPPRFSMSPGPVKPSPAPDEQGLDDDDTPPPTLDDLEIEQEEREDELMSAFAEFLYIVTDGGAEDLGDADMEDALDHVLQYISDNLCLPVYRPTVYFDADTGSAAYTLYPYAPDPDIHQFP